MLVDSGADTSFIPLHIANILKIKLGKPIEARSASGPFMIKKGTINVTLIKGHIEIPLGQIPVDVPIQELKGGNQLDYALLGRIGLFTQFDITFREKTKKLLLKSPKTGFNS